MRHLVTLGVAMALATGLAACNGKPQAPKQDAAAFVARLNEEMGALSDELNAAGWTQATYITPDTQLLSAHANDRYLAYFSKAVADARQYEQTPKDAATTRALALLKQGVSAPAPDDAAKRAELAKLAAGLEAAYGEGKYCVDKAGKQECRNIDQLSETLAGSRDFATLTEAWAGWHSIAKPMRQDYQRFVALANEGARELGYADLGAMWRSGYDMSPEAFEQEVERLWGQVKPLYEQMHCYARSQLAHKYGEDKVPAGKPIPAQLLGNLWAQQWNKIYEDILKPYPAVAAPSIDSALQGQHYDAVRMARSAESFYTSLGFRQLPASFWERSMLTRPRDREVVCHASAWQMDRNEDVRIKQCITPTEEDLQTIYHEMGHVYYDLSYKDQPFLFQGGAHDGFHEAIGDTIVLSMTPGYYASVGLAPKVKPSRESVINEQMKMAADKIAFLPFGKLVDQWRWQVFSGRIQPQDYNKAWWALREKYQGVSAPLPRSEADFDPGAKYHVPGNTPYTRYFLSFILQFQFHRALCEAAGFKGPLHECSVHGNTEAGKRFAAMLAAGQSRPWPETLEKLTGSRQMDASAIIDYFQPLMGWLQDKNKNQHCGWEGSST
jgi:peptidyl-dipeptidase A